MRAARGARQTERAQEQLARTKALVVSRIGEARFAAAEQNGRTLTEEVAISLALENAA